MSSPRKSPGSPQKSKVPDFRALFESSPTPYLVVVPPDFTIIAVNDQYLRATMTDRESIMGKGFFEVFPDNPNDPGADGVRNLRASLERVVATRRPDVMAVQKYDIRRPASEGGAFEERYWSPLNSPLLDDNGEVSCIIHRVENVTETVQLRSTSAAQDQLMRDQQALIDRLRQANEELVSEVAERKRVEGELLQSEQRFREIVATTPECVKVVAQDGTLLHMNAAGLGMVGADCAEMVVGRNIYNVIAPEHRDHFRQFNESVCRGERGALEFDIIDARGVRHHMATHAAPLRQSDGSCLQLAVTRDVSERKQAEEALARSEERFRALVTASSDAVYSMSPDWSEMRHLHGRGFVASTSEPLRSWLAEYIHPDDQAAVTAAIGTAIRTKSIFELEHRVQRLDGSVGWAFSRAVPLLDDNGEILEWFGAATDVTQRKQAEEALRKADKLAGAGRMAATIAHEINNPLEAVINLWFLASKEVKSAAGKQYMEALGSELNRIAHITKQTLQFYREGRNVAILDIGELLENTVKPLATFAASRGAQITTAFRAAASIQAHEGEMRQVFRNFITNALEAGATRISVRVSDCTSARSASGKAVRITFADNGGGISTEAAYRLFEPFFTTKDEKGTGLGLWVSKGIIQKHDGHIRVRSSTTAGRSGTTFCIFLPAQAKKASETAA